MSVKHPIVAITGSSGAGTSTVTKSFDLVFRREKLKAAIVEGDSFHRYDRKAMKVAMEEARQQGNNHFSHFGPEANLLEELADLFKGYGETGRASCASICTMPKRRPRTASSRANSRPGPTFPRAPT
jgi:phosphoribulokinase